ncbi:MAG: hypothetical protein ACYDC6_10125 [Acidobacteriaceae bacterium]
MAGVLPPSVEYAADQSNVPQCHGEKDGMIDPNPFYEWGSQEKYFTADRRPDLFSWLPAPPKSTDDRTSLVAAIG